MSEPVSEHLRSEIEALFKHLEVEWSITCNQYSTAQWTRLKHLAKVYVCMTCFCESLTENKPRAEFLKNLPEVYYFSLTLGAKGYVNNFATTLRQGIELAYKHIYFFSHPIEYSWVIGRVDFKEMGNAYLVSFLNKTIETSDAVVMKHFKEINTIYGELSRYVHTQNPEYFGLTKLKASSDIAKGFKSINSYYPRLARSLIIFLIAYFPMAYRGLNEPEKRLIEKIFTSASHQKDLHHVFSVFGVI